MDQQGGLSPALQRSSKDLLLETLGVLRKQLWYALLFFVVVSSSVAFWTFRQVPLYEAAATLIIDSQPPRVLDDVREVVELGTGSFWSNREYYETQYKVIASRAIAERVIARTGLANNLAFLGLSDESVPERLAARLAAADAVSILRADLRVEPVPDSRIVRVVFRHRVPELAQLVANTVVQVYRESNLEYRSKANLSATQNLGAQFGELKQTLEASEERLAAFKAQRGILVANVEGQLGILAERIQVLNGTINGIESERERLEARLKRIRAMDLTRDWGSLEEVISSSLFAQLKESYLQLRQERIKLAVDLLERHPKVQAVDEQLALLRKGIDEEVRLIVSHLERKLASLVDAEQSHRARLARLEAEARKLDELSVTYERLRRDVDENAALYKMVVTRLRETSLSGQIESNNIRLLDLALLPTLPVRPRTRLNLALGLLLGLLGGVGFAFLVEYLDRTIRTREDIERLGVPFLGIAPIVKAVDLAKGRTLDTFVIDHPRSSAAECARIVRTNLLFANPEGELRRLVVSSASPKEGKTHTALNIAATMALSGKRVLLIDSDMRRPRLHKALGLRNRAGLSNLIVGKGRIEELAQPTGVPHLDFLSCGPVPPNPAELLQTDRFVALLEHLSSVYDRIVLDSPPIMAVADPLIIAQHTDGVILVVRAGETSREMAFRSIQALRDVQGRILGAVLNRVDVERPGYNRYYYYRRGYKGYYLPDTETSADAETLTDLDDPA